MPAAPVAPSPATPASPAPAQSPRTDAAGIVPPAQVSASSIAPPVEPTGAPKAGSAKARMYQTLEKYAGKGTDTPAAAATTDDAPAPEATKPADAPKPARSTKPDEAPKPAATDPNAPAKPTDPVEPDRGKAKPDKSFWQAYDSWKSRAIKAEEELSKAASAPLAEGERKSLEERVTKAESRAKELEDHIRFVDYSKSEEFKSKYEQPYVSAWKRAMSDISEITVKDPQTGEQRQADPRDLQVLLNMSLGDARALANDMFGDFANDVMNYRKEIKSLFDAQTLALDEARKNGETRQKELSERTSQQLSAMQAEIKSTWERENQAALANKDHGEFFKPIDGNEEVNSRLKKGFEMVDRAFTLNPADPKLTPQQRAEVVRLHAAVRNRAAAYGRLVYELRDLRAKLADANKKLDGYQASSPTTTGRGGTPTAQPGGDRKTARQQLYEDLEKLASR